MFKYKIVETKTPYVSYCEIYQRFLGFLWWRKWEGVRVATYTEAVHLIQTYKITWEEVRTNA